MGTVVSDYADDVRVLCIVYNENVYTLENSYKKGIGSDQIIEIIGLTGPDQSVKYIFQPGPKSSQCLYIKKIFFFKLN